MFKNTIEVKQVRWMALVFAASLLFATTAFAAPLNFTTSENISLSSPATTLTVATGSLADALTVTTSTVAVSLSSSTTGSFTLISPSYNLAVATSSGGGTANISCTLGIESAVLSQVTGSTVYTVTASGTTCAANAPPSVLSVSVSGITTSGATVSWTTNVLATTTVEYGTSVSYGSSVNDANLTTGDSVTLSGLSAGTLYHVAVIAYANGTSTVSGDTTFTTSAVSVPPAPPVVTGGGGSIGVAAGQTSPGSGVTIPSAPVSSPTSTAPVSSGGSSDAALIAEIQSLEAQLAGLQAEVNNQSSPSSASFVFTRDLHIGMVGDDVNALQRYLVAENAGPAAQKLAQHGTTQTFGALTQAALAEFQKSVGIVPPVGYFGPITRAWIAAHP